MHVAQNLAKRDIVLKVKHVAKRLHLAGVVIKHQQHAGVGEDDEQQKRNPAHAPGVAIAHRIAINLRRMQMEEDVREHAQRAIARRVIMLVAEDRGVDLRLGRIFQALNLLLRLRGDVGLQRLNIIFDAGGHLSSNPAFSPFLPFGFVFVSHKII